MEEKKGLPFLFLAKHRKSLERRAGLWGALPDPHYHISSPGFGVSPTARSRITAERIPSTAPDLTTPGPWGSLHAQGGGANPSSLSCIPQGVKDMHWDRLVRTVLPPGSPASPSAAAPRKGGGWGRCCSAVGRHRAARGREAAGSGAEGAEPSVEASCAWS